MHLFISIDFFLNPPHSLGHVFQPGLYHIARVEISSISTFGYFGRSILWNLKHGFGTSYIFGSSTEFPQFISPNLPLICGWKFPEVNILYHHEAFDDRLLTTIDSACPNRIPMMTTDISIPGPFEIPQIERADYILQVIILPRDQLKETMDQISGLLTFYRVFIFSSNQEQDSPQKLMADVEYISNLNSSSLLLIHNKSNSAFISYLRKRNLSTSMELVDFSQSESQRDLFDSALGGKAFERYFGVSFSDKVECGLLSLIQKRVGAHRDRAFARLYFLRLRMSFIDAISIRCSNSVALKSNKHVRPKNQPSYSELSSNFEAIEEK